MKKLTLILAAMVLTASQAFGQCGKCGYEVKALFTLLPFSLPSRCADG